MMIHIYSFRTRIKAPDDDNLDNLFFAFENNYNYYVMQNNKLKLTIKKDYITELLFHSDHDNNLGYSYKPAITDNSSYYYSNKIINFEIYCDPTILKDRIYNNQIKDFENIFFEALFKYKNNYDKITEEWKNNWTPNNILAKQPKKLDVKLFKYQLESLNWMKQIEISGNRHKLFTNRKLCEILLHKDLDEIYFDIFNSKLNLNNYKNYYTTDGAILADEMGLGKTITSIALTIENPYVYQPNKEFESLKIETHINNDIELLKVKATLIICPSHLTKQWSLEIAKANKNINKLLILTKREHNKYKYKDILEADIIIVSFQFLLNINYYVNYDGSQRLTKSNFGYEKTLNERFNKMKKLRKFNTTDFLNEEIIFENIHWYRLIVDEAHEIFQASSYENQYLLHFIKNLISDHKWYVSGTPFYDRKSLNNVMNFLNFKSIKNVKGDDFLLDFNVTMDQGLNGANILDSIFSQIYIRNTKESVKDQLTIPNAIVENLLMEFSDFEKNLYNSISNGKHNEIYLRKICCNIQIHERFGGDISNIMNLDQVKEKIIEDNQKNIIKLQLTIQNLDPTIAAYKARKKSLENKISASQFLINSFNKEIKINEDCCPICRCDFDDPVVTNCGHNYCYECITEVLGMSSYKKECPICRAPISSSQIYRIESKVEEEEKVDDLVYQYGTKLAKLIKLCKKILLNPKNKIIIFSEWDRLLKMIGIVLKNNEINNVFCKGNVHQRNAAISAFRKEINKKKKNKSRVIMLSTENAASGTNLTEATHIIFMEPHVGNYNKIKAMEDQAIGRAVRLGQENQVCVYRLIMKDTVEEKILTDYLNGKDTGEKVTETKNQSLNIDI